MELIRVILLTLLLSLFAGNLALAQEEDKDFTLTPHSTVNPAPNFLSYFFQPQYNQIVRRAVVAWPKPVDFRHLRMMYMHTRQYDPLGEETLKKLAELSYAAETSMDTKEKQKKSGEFRDLVLDHLGNIDVVLQALSLARDNPIYGDPAFYEWVVIGTQEDLMSGYNGRSMKKAYTLITMADEAFIFSRLKVKSVHSELVSDGANFYAIHLVEEFKTKKQYELFINTSIPMRHLKALHNASGKSSRPVNIRKQ